MSETALNVATAAVTLIALALTALATLAWRRSGTIRGALLALGFAVFLVGGALATAWLFQGRSANDVLLGQMTTTAIGLLLVYVATVKR